MNFFIMGLPRSRTAWLANFMNYDGIFCYHEGLNNCRSMSEYKEKLGHHGDSGTGLVLFDLDYYFPKNRKIIIDSTTDRSIEFIKEHYGQDETGMMVNLKSRLDAAKGLHICLDDINDNLPEIWGYLTDKPYDKERGDLLKDLNVQMQDLGILNVDAAAELIEKDSR